MVAENVIEYIDEFHPHATRTLFIASIHRNATASDLRTVLEPFGEILKIDIAKGNLYALIEYSDITSVLKAMHTLDGEYVAGRLPLRPCLGFGKSLATPYVWIDGVSRKIREQCLTSHFNQFGNVTRCIFYRSREQAIVFFDQISDAQSAVTEMHCSTLIGRKIQVDFASKLLVIKLASTRKYKH